METATSYEKDKYESPQGKRSQSRKGDKYESPQGKLSDEKEHIRVSTGNISKTTSARERETNLDRVSVSGH